ncbi:zinc knuckle CX2CX4HX4C containing protein [Tanacetum coccineum]
MEDIGRKDKRESTNEKVNALRANLEESGATCDGSPKVSNSSPWVSPNATINMPRGLYNVDVAATFGVPLTTVGDLHLLIKSIEAGKHDELLSGMTNDERMAIMDALGAICNSIQADNTNADVIPCKVSHVDDSTNLNVDESTMPNDPIVQSVDINTKSKSYTEAAGASAKDQPKVKSNFRPLVADLVFDGVNISIPRKVVEKVSTRFKHTLYGYFIGNRMAFLVVEYYARNNWAKHGLKRIMMKNKGFFFFKFDSRGGLEAVLEGGPWLIHNDGFQTVGKKKKRKGKSKSTNGGQFVGPLVKPNVRYEPKANTSAPKKGATNMEEDEEDVKNVYEELANLFPNIKTVGISSFTVAAG